MILFLTTNDHVNLLDFSEQPHKKMVGSFLLHQFVVHDMRNFSHCTHLILDRAAIAERDGEFVQVIEEFLTMYTARVTVICEGLTMDSTLFRGLLEIGVGNIVTATEIDAIQAEIREVLSEQGMTRYVAKERARPAGVYRFTCAGVQIAVVGSHPRMGATTAAIGLTRWLLGAGATVCYIEDNPSGHLRLLADVYQMAQVDGGYEHEGALYLSHGEPEAVNFIVRDLGSDYRAALPRIQAAEVAVLLGGAKPYELPETVAAIREIGPRPLALLLPFVAETLRGDYLKLLAVDGRRVLFSEYQPDPMEAGPNKDVFLKIIQPYITVG